ncbi:MAG: PilZ domain-containing protein [Deltaproteobacteria bacterium]|nr:PilZ domain-containing protein [Deltaproteobacteria bacterium]MBI4794265.1 PilZ domain-containing protein [Deltaproteobacteria bacterium]
MPERRRHRRYPRQLRVRCKNPQLAFESLTRDICAGGVFIITSHQLPLDSSIDLEISFGADEPFIHCRGRIVWINAGQLETFPPGFGVEFLEEDEQVMGRLLHDLGV